MRVKVCRDVHEADDGNDFEHGKDVFSFSVPLDSKHVDGQDEDEENGDKDASRYGVVPVLDRERCSNHFQWQNRQPLYGVAEEETLVSKQDWENNRSVVTREHATYFQPMAKPHDGSKNRVDQVEKEPAMGNTTASSPSAWHVQ